MWVSPLCQMEFRVHRSVLTGRWSLAWALGCMVSAWEGLRETTLWASRGWRCPSSPAPVHQPQLSCAWGVMSYCSETVAQLQPRQPCKLLLYPVASILQRALNPSPGKGKGTPPKFVLPWALFFSLGAPLELSSRLYSFSPVSV